MARETRESERECMISLFQGAGFDRWEQVLHRLELTVYRSRYYRCIYCIEPATVRPLRTLCMPRCHVGSICRKGEVLDMHAIRQQRKQGTP